MIILHDDFGNTATIEEKMLLGYKDARTRTKAYVLTLTADYDNNFVYHVSVYDRMEDLERALEKISCGTWK